MRILWREAGIAALRLRDSDRLRQPGLPDQRGPDAGSARLRHGQAGLPDLR